MLTHSCGSGRHADHEYGCKGFGKDGRKTVRCECPCHGTRPDQQLTIHHQEKE